MGKVAKGSSKIAYRVISIIIFCFMLAVIIFGGILVYGQFHEGTGTNFDTLISRNKVKKACNAFCKGSSDELMEMSNGYAEEMYFKAIYPKTEGVESFTKDLKDGLNKLYEEYIRGTNMKVSNVRTSYTPTGMTGDSSTILTTEVLFVSDDIEFYISFAKQGVKYMISAYTNTDNLGTGSEEFVNKFNHLIKSYGDKKFILNNIINSYKVQNNIENYDRLTTYFSQPDSTIHLSDKNTIYRKKINDNLMKAFELGAKIKKVTFSEMEYDCDMKKFIFTMVFSVEDKNNMIFMYSKEFYYGYTGYEPTTKPCEVINSGVDEKIVDCFRNAF